MSKKYFTEEELEGLLRDMPKISDHRHRDEIYRSVQERMHEEKNEIKRKRIFWPALASLAATLILIVLGSSLLSREDHLTHLWQNQKSQERITITQDKEEMAPGAGGGATIVEERLEIFDSQVMEANRTAIYQESLTDEEMAITLNIPDRSFQNIIPVSVIVQKENEKTWLDHYLEISAQIDEEELGLADYYPLQGTLTLEGDDALKLNLATDNPYTVGTTSEEMFFRGLDAFRHQGIKEIRLFVDDRPGLDLHHEVEPLTVYSIAPYGRTGYWLYETERQTFLTPGPSNYKTVTETLVDMKNDIATHELIASIPERIQFKVEEEGPRTLTIRFSEDIILSEEPEMMYMIEAILLTAKEFGYNEVRFININGNTDLFGWDFTKTIKVPVAPNRLQLMNH